MEIMDTMRRFAQVFLENQVFWHQKGPRKGAFLENGGERGIRTLGTRKSTTVFETAPIDHSGISPYLKSHGRGGRRLAQRLWRCKAWNAPFADIIYSAAFGIGSGLCSGGLAAPLCGEESVDMRGFRGILPPFRPRGPCPGDLQCAVRGHF